MKVLINDGLEDSGIKALKAAGIEVELNKIKQEDLGDSLNQYDGILVRSATKVRKDIIDKSPNLKFIGRGGVGMDNIDVDYARSKGIHVFNTPAASSRSVAELAMAHILGLTRSLHESARNLKDDQSFTKLKKKFSSASEVKNKTLVLLGFGRIGSELAKIALGLEMRIIVVDPFIKSASVTLTIMNHKIDIDLPMSSKEDAIGKADYISLHAPFSGSSILSEAEFNILKPNCIIVNTSRGENIDEAALLDALNSNKIAGAGLDVFHNEPFVKKELLEHPKVSVSPHIGASTAEAQERIAEEIVDQILKLQHNY
ncbi:MAG: 3-phosphoglycerate dehydrogenase [Saprospiraceae bacterium]|nr:3-phosphoglycerate dehydrogenase [Saprospiraceae bacterium]